MYGGCSRGYGGCSGVYGDVVGCMGDVVGPLCLWGIYFGFSSVD